MIAILHQRLAAWEAMGCGAILDFSNLRVPSIQSYIPANCTRLSLEGCGLYEIPSPLPSGLEELYVDKNRITHIDGARLPSTLVGLVVSHNDLTTLPSSLPLTLKYLFASHNRIKDLPDRWPPILERLSLHHNEIQIFPLNLPETLQLFYMSYNNIQYMCDTIPRKLLELYVEHNRFLVVQTKIQREGPLIYEYVDRLIAFQRQEEERKSRERALERLNLFRDDLIATVYHPDNVYRLIDINPIFPQLIN